MLHRVLRLSIRGGCPNVPIVVLLMQRECRDSSLVSRCSTLAVIHSILVVSCRLILVVFIIIKHQSSHIVSFVILRENLAARILICELLIHQNSTFLVFVAGEQFSCLGE